MSKGIAGASGETIFATRATPDCSEADCIHIVCLCVYGGRMASGKSRVNVVLGEEQARKLSLMAERAHVQEGTLARSLLSNALDAADPDARAIATLLDAIPGAWERTQEGIEQARRGEGVSLDELI